MKLRDYVIPLLIGFGLACLLTLLDIPWPLRFAAYLGAGIAYGVWQHLRDRSAS